MKQEDLDILLEEQEAPLVAPDVALDLIRRRIRLRARRRIMWLRTLWQEMSGGSETPNYHAVVDAILDEKDTPEREAAWMATNEQIQALNDSLVEVEKALEEGDSRFHFLVRQFGLSTVESDFFQAALALGLEPQLDRVYAYLQDHAGRGYVTETLVTRLFGYRQGGAIGASSALRRLDLLHEREMNPGEPAMYVCDPFIRDWLLGRDSLDPALAGMAYWRLPPEPLAGWPLDETVNYLHRQIEREDGLPLRLIVTGFPGSGRRSFAAALAGRLQLPLLVLDSGHIAEAEWERVYMRGQRQAFLTGCIPAWSGSRWTQWRWPPLIAPFRIQMALAEIDESVPPMEGIVDFRVELPPLSIEERRRLWRDLVPETAGWRPEALEAMSRRFQVNIGQIAAVADRGGATAEEAAEIVRESSRQRLGKLAQQLPCTFRWDDLIVSDWIRQTLEDFVFEAREREIVWEQPAAQRLFSQGKGLLALFSGPSGTGKTMAAQVIAATLDLDLFRIDLSTVVSKYVGETSKNLERILSRARHMNAVLLFDEADALFGKRTDVKDAHDRYANTDTNYLLQAIESYPGVAILATNKKANIDSGFIRRLRYVLNFPKPDTGQRLLIWRRLIGELAGTAILEGLSDGLISMAGSLDLTGAQIKYAILSALFIARKGGEELGIPHVVRGLERELAKEGRSISRELREKLKY